MLLNLTFLWKRFSFREIRIVGLSVFGQICSLFERPNVLIEYGTLKCVFIVSSCCSAVALVRRPLHRAPALCVHFDGVSMTTRPMNLVIYLGAVGCSSSAMEEIQVKPFAFPQDVRLVVFGTKLFKVKVVFRGGQVR